MFPVVLGSVVPVPLLDSGGDVVCNLVILLVFGVIVVVFASVVSVVVAIFALVFVFGLLMFPRRPGLRRALYLHCRWCGHRL